MPRRQPRPTRGARWLRALHGCVTTVAHWLWRRLGFRQRRIPVEVLIADRNRRRTLERELHAGINRLQRVLGIPLPPHVAVVVQQVIRTDRQLAGCYQVSSAGGVRCSLIRLALEVNGKRLTIDELLAALAEQCIGLTTQESGGTAVVVPVEFEPVEPPAEARLRAFRPDPLAAQTGDPFYHQQAV